MDFNFAQYSMKHYDNPHCRTHEEFLSDCFKFVNIRKMLGKDKSNTHLILNNIVVLYNVFERYPCTVMLFHKVPQEHWHKLKTFLVYLNTMPEVIPELNIKSVDINLCSKTVSDLRKI
jgi:hypothetical protein